jgi:hypothetical protein
MLPSRLPSERLPEIEPQNQFLDALRTPKGLLDLRKLLLNVDFPVYFLLREPFSFYLWGVNTGGMGQRIINVALVYVSPSHTAPTYVVMISSADRDAYPRDIYPEQIFDSLTLLSTIKSLLIGYLPSRYGSAFTQRDHAHREREVERLWQERFSNDLASAPLTETTPQFRAARWDQPAPLSLAYRDTEKLRVVVGSIGTSQAEFLTILTSLAPLQPDDHYNISKLESERSMTAEALKQKGDQWVI